MAKRKNGDGNWGTRTINGTQYKYYRKFYEWKDDYHTFYGKTEKEINQKRERFEFKNRDKHKLDIKNIEKEQFYYYCKNWVEKIKPYDGTDTEQVTIDSYSDIIEHRVKNTLLGNTQIGSLNKEVFQNYIDNYCVKEKKYARSTIKRTQSLLNQICEYLYKNDNYASCNYMENIVIPSEKNIVTKKREIPFLNESDMQKLYNEFSKTNSTGKRKYGINSYVIIFIMYTGLRISECLALKWEDVDFNLNIIHITHSIVKIKNSDNKTPKHILKDTDSTKTYTSNRSIPLSEIALNILKELNHNQDKKCYIFSNDGITIINSRNVTRTLNIMQENAKCEVKKCGLHSLRHTFGSYLILKGTDIKTVSELLGHSSIEITLNIYIHVINAQKASAIKLFDNIKRTNIQQNNNIIKKLGEYNIDIIEIEEGMLGYIKSGKLIKLPINKSIEVNDIIIDNIDIYNEYYRKEGML